MKQVFPQAGGKQQVFQSSAPRVFGHHPSRPLVCKDVVLTTQVSCRNLQFVLLVLLFDFFQDVNFQPGCFSVFSNIFYDFQRHLRFASVREETKGWSQRTKHTYTCPQSTDSRQNPFTPVVLSCVNKLSHFWVPRKLSGVDQKLSTHMEV